MVNSRLAEVENKENRKGELMNIYEIGRSCITDEEIQETKNKIIEVLRKGKRTYSVNKFILEETIKDLGEYAIV